MTGKCGLGAVEAELERVKAERDRLGERYQDAWRTLEGVAKWLGLTVEGLGEDPSSAANPANAERAAHEKTKAALRDAEREIETQSKWKVAERARAEKLREALKVAADAITEGQGWHDESDDEFGNCICPEDDTCDCSLVRIVNDALAATEVKP